MKSLRIGVDVDDTLANFVAPLIDFLKSNGLKVPSYEDTHDYDLWNVWGCTREEAIKRIEYFHNSNGFDLLSPLPGVQEVFMKTFPPHVAYSITNRPPKLEHITKRFLDNHFGGRYEAVYHLGTNYDGKKISKADVAKKNSLDLFVEDSHYEAQSISSIGIPVLLINRPWNRGRETNSLVTRVDGWEEVLMHVERYASN